MMHKALRPATIMLIALLLFTGCLHLRSLPEYEPTDADLEHISRYEHPDNGFLLFLEAYDMLEETPHKLEPELENLFDADTISDALRQHLIANAPALNTLRKGFNTPYCIAPFMTPFFSNGEFETMIALRELARQLSYQSQLARIDGDMDAVMHASLDCIQLSRMSVQEGYVILSLVGIAIQELGLAPLKRDLPSFNEDQLRRIITTLEREEKLLISYEEAEANETTYNLSEDELDESELGELEEIERMESITNYKVAKVFKLRNAKLLEFALQVRIELYTRIHGEAPKDLESVMDGQAVTPDPFTMQAFEFVDGRPYSEGIENRGFLDSLQIDFFPEQVELPDPLLREYDKPITKAKQWKKHRSTILYTVMEYEYGHTPETAECGSAPQIVPDHIGGDELGTYLMARPSQELIHTNKQFEELSQLSIYTLNFGYGGELSTTLHLYIPRDGKADHPVIVRFGLGGEHAQAANERGYAFACFEQTSLDPDTEGHDVVGPAQEMYPDATWGSVAVWAWGASRVLDYLETREDIDTTRSVITGHSRTGKAALLAGVLDERFAVVVPNGSGAGGAATFRGAGKGNETLELITRESRFKSWFHEDFGQFGEHVNKLPFDQHYMRALIAPRVVLSTDAYDDKWCYPEGVQRAWEGAQPVFDLLGVPEHNLIHFREGGHDQLAPDFDVLLDVADAHFNGESFPKNLRTAPFPK